MTRNRRVSAILIVPEDRHGASLRRMLDADPRFKVTATFASLDAAYSPTELAPPDIVICRETITATPEFPMFNALIELLSVRLIAVPDTADARSIGTMLGLKPIKQTSSVPDKPLITSGPSDRIIAIGASTGGIEALSKVFSTFPSDCPPTIVVQHIKPEFLDSVVTRLDRTCRPNVRAAADRDMLETGKILFAPGMPRHLEIDTQRHRCAVRDGPLVCGHRPSVDRMMQSLVPIADRVVGVLLTGMGRDGATGLGALKRGGAWTIAQDAASSTVYGMPRVAAQEDATREVVGLDRMATAILRAAHCNAEVQL